MKCKRCGCSTRSLFRFISKVLKKILRRGESGDFFYRSLIFQSLKKAAASSAVGSQQYTMQTKRKILFTETMLYVSRYRSFNAMSFLAEINAVICMSYNPKKPTNENIFKIHNEIIYPLCLERTFI